MALDTVLSDLEGIGYKARAFVIPACAVNTPHKRDRCAIVAHTDRLGHIYREAEIEPAKAGKQAQSGPVRCGEAMAHADSKRCNQFKPAAVTDQAEAISRSDYERNVSDTDRAMLESAVTDGDAPGGAGPTDSGAVSDTDDRSGTVRRHGELSAVEEAGRSRDYIRGRTPEHGGRERRPAQPGMGGSHDGLSSWMDSVRTGWADGTWEYGIARIARDVPERVNRLKCLGNAVVPAQFYPIFQAIADIERSGV